MTLKLWLKVIVNFKVFHGANEIRVYKGSRRINYDFPGCKSVVFM